MVPDAADADHRVHVADPVELGGVEPASALAEQRFKQRGMGEVRDHRAVLRRHIVGPVGGREAGGPDHVLRDELGIARDEAAHVPRQHAAVEVEAGPDLVPDHHR